MNIKNILVGLFCSLAVVGCSGGMGDGCCGWSGLDITAAGQVKTVRLNTPLVCPDYFEVDISLGVMRNGVGSMSTHDMTLYVSNEMAVELKKAAQDSAIVDFTYNQRRSGLCVPDNRLTAFRRVP